MYKEDEYSDPHDDFFTLQIDRDVYCRATDEKPRFIVNIMTRNVKVPDWCPLKEGALDTVLVHRNKVGDIVTFGPYSWQVIDVKYGKTMLLCMEKIEMEEEGSLEKFLDNDFLQRFSPEEIDRIAEPYYALFYNIVHNTGKFLIFDEGDAPGNGAEESPNSGRFNVHADKGNPGGKKDRYGAVLMVNPATRNMLYNKTCTDYNGGFRPVVMIENLAIAEPEHQSWGKQQNRS